MEAVINGGADLNLKDGRGSTPLIKAVLKFESKIIALLVGAGADPHISDEIGSSALEYAEF